MYNLVNYIHTEKRNGVKERDILSNLRKAGWSSEQLRYVIRKYAGRRTGMLEIPIDKVIKKIFGKEKANVDNTNGANFQRRQY